MSPTFTSVLYNLSLSAIAFSVGALPLALEKQRGIERGNMTLVCELGLKTVSRKEKKNSSESSHLKAVVIHQANITSEIGLEQGGSKALPFLLTYQPTSLYCFM